eukprot:scaffold1297_cov368-Prasinococcus_capsulatus_cf.AAC.7
MIAGREGGRGHEGERSGEGVRKRAATAGRRDRSPLLPHPPAPPVAVAGPLPARGPAAAAPSPLPLLPPPRARATLKPPPGAAFCGAWGRRSPPRCAPAGRMATAPRRGSDAGAAGPRTHAPTDGRTNERMDGWMAGMGWTGGVDGMMGARPSHPIPSSPMRGEVRRGEARRGDPRRAAVPWPARLCAAAGGGSVVDGWMWRDDGRMDGWQAALAAAAAAGGAAAGGAGADAGEGCWGCRRVMRPMRARGCRCCRARRVRGTPWPALACLMDGRAGRVD